MVDGHNNKIIEYDIIGTCHTSLYNIYLYRDMLETDPVSTRRKVGEEVEGGWWCGGGRCRCQFWGCYAVTRIQNTRAYRR